MPSRSVDDLHPLLRAKVRRLFAEWWPIHGRGRELIVTETYRSPEEQLEAFARGASQLDGTHRFSRHNFRPAFACDVGIVETAPDGRRVVAADGELYRPLGEFASGERLEWGGWWGVRRGTSATTRAIGWDACHLELRWSDVVQIAQRLLDRAGCHPGTPDGWIGPRTRGAILRLQAAAGVPPTGELDPETWQALWSLAGATPEEVVA